MTAEDDRIRRALSSGEPSFTAHSALQQLRPTMQRARLRRRVAAGATTLCAVGRRRRWCAHTGDLAGPPTLRTVNNDETGQSAPADRATDNRATDNASPGRHCRSPSDGHRSRTEPSSVAPEADDAAPAADNGRAPAPRTQFRRSAPPHRLRLARHLPRIAAPPAIVAPAVSQTIASECGDVIVSIENGTVRIVTHHRPTGLRISRCQTTARSRSRSFCAVPRTSANSMPNSSRAGWTSKYRTPERTAERDRPVAIQLSTLPTSTSARGDRAGLSFALRAARISTMVRNITMLMEARAAMRNTSPASVPAAIA